MSELRTAAELESKQGQPADEQRGRAWLGNNRQGAQQRDISRSPDRSDERGQSSGQIHLIEISLSIRTRGTRNEIGNPGAIGIIEPINAGYIETQNPSGSIDARRSVERPETIGERINSKHG